MTSALAERELTAPLVTTDQLDLIKKTVANGATDAELKLYLFDCARRGIHPLDKLLHFTKRGGKYTPVTSIDFMRSQAAMSGEMAGSDDAVFSGKADATGVGHLDLESATVTVYRLTAGQRFAYTATARWSEYCPDNAQMWKRMPHTMLAKCAEALALRKAFPQQLAGLYAKEELDQADRTETFIVEAPKEIESHGMGVKAAPRQPPQTVLDPVGPSARSDAEVLASSSMPKSKLPPGLVLITRVKGGMGKSLGFIFTSAMHPGDGEGIAIYQESLLVQAQEVCQLLTPVKLTTKMPPSGKPYVTAIQVVELAASEAF